MSNHSKRNEEKKETFLNKDELFNQVQLIKKLQNKQTEFAIINFIGIRKKHISRLFWLKWVLLMMQCEFTVNWETLNNVNCSKKCKEIWCADAFANMRNAEFSDGNNVWKWEMLRKRVMCVCVLCARSMAAFFIFNGIYVLFFHQYFGYTCAMNLFPCICKCVCHPCYWHAHYKKWKSFNAIPHAYTHFNVYGSSSVLCPDKIIDWISFSNIA